MNKAIDTAANPDNTKHTCIAHKERYYRAIRGIWSTTYQGVHCGKSFRNQCVEVTKGLEL